MIWKGIIGLASSKTPITNQIGTSPMRLFPVMLPQGMATFPAVAAKLIINNPMRSFDGDEKYDDTNYDFHSYAKTKKEAEATAIILRDNLEGASGTFNGIVFEDVQFMPSGTEDYLDDLELYTYSIEVQFDVRR